MEEIITKGMILAAAPQGEYGRRLILLTDSLGKITVFASGAAKTGSRLIGKVRPFTAGSFTLARGRGAYNIHGAEIIDSFEEIPLDPDAAMYGFYVLELAEYFSAEGMAESEARELLNLSFMALSALREKKASPSLIVRLLELRLLKLCGEYTQLPPLIYGGTQKQVVDGRSEKAGNESLAKVLCEAEGAGTAGADSVVVQWQKVLAAPISRVFGAETLTGKDTAELEKNIEHLFKKQILHKFKSAKLIRDF